MDFLEKIGYTDRGKRLRKRLPHYSQSSPRVNPYLIKAFPSCRTLGVIVENNCRWHVGTRKTLGGPYREPADRVGCQSCCGGLHQRSFRQEWSLGRETGDPLSGVGRRANLSRAQRRIAGSLREYVFPLLQYLGTNNPHLHAGGTRGGLDHR